MAFYVRVRHWWLYRSLHVRYGSRLQNVLQIIHTGPPSTLGIVIMIEQFFFHLMYLILWDCISKHEKKVEGSELLYCRHRSRWLTYYSRNTGIHQSIIYSLIIYFFSKAIIWFKLINKMLHSVRLHNYFEKRVHNSLENLSGSCLDVILHNIINSNNNYPF